MTDLSLWILLSVVLSLGIFIQAAAGFAAGLLIVSILSWYGYPIPEAQAALIVATIPQNLLGMWQFRRFVPWRQVVWPAVGRLLFMPIGVEALHWLELVSVETLKQIVGGIVLLVTLSVCFIQPTPRPQLPKGWAFLAFPISGFLQGMVGMGGPPMVMWVQAHDWDTKRIRGFLFTMYLISIIPTYGLLAWRFGERVIEPSVITLALLPIMLLATHIGLRAGTRLGSKRLRQVTIVILIITGLAAVVAPL